MSDRIWLLPMKIQWGGNRSGAVEGIVWGSHNVLGRTTTSKVCLGASHVYEDVQVIDGMLELDDSILPSRSDIALWIYFAKKAG
jgi:hypothetical protein